MSINIGEIWGAKEEEKKPFKLKTTLPSSDMTPKERDYHHINQFFDLTDEFFTRAPGLHYTDGEIMNALMCTREDLDAIVDRDQDYWWKKRASFLMVRSHFYQHLKSLEEQGLYSCT